jgi:hypothetical protein
METKVIKMGFVDYLLIFIRPREERLYKSSLAHPIEQKKLILHNYFTNKFCFQSKIEYFGGLIAEKNNTKVKNISY